MSSHFSNCFLASALVDSGSGAAASATGIFWQVALIILFVLLNGFFVSAEFALVKVRTSQLDEIIDEGKPRGRVKRATLARQVLRNLDSFLSAAQLGITICSLVLGALAEPFVHRLVAPLLGAGGAGLSDWWVRVISWTVAIVSVTSLHVVVGEQMPKTLAIRRRAGSLALGQRADVVVPLGLQAADLAAQHAPRSRLLRWIFKVETAEEGHVVHSSEELRLLVEQSEKKSEVTETERDILVNALELSERIVRDIMTPRSSVVALDANKDFRANVQRAVESKHTRFPLIDRHFQNTLGLVHIKDLLAVLNEPEPDLRRIKRELLAVPELLPLDKLLKFFLAKHAHLALVVDEFGGTIGMVTLDDVMEELVGTIHDEFDAEERLFQRLSDDEFLVDGGMPLYDLAEFTELELESDDVSTIGGYLTEKIGHLPNLGEKAAHRRLRGHRHPHQRPPRRATPLPPPHRKNARCTAFSMSRVASAWSVIMPVTRRTRERSLALRPATAESTLCRHAGSGRFASASKAASRVSRNAAAPASEACSPNLASSSVAASAISEGRFSSTTLLKAGSFGASKRPRALSTAPGFPATCARSRASASVGSSAIHRSNAAPRAASRCFGSGSVWAHAMAAAGSSAAQAPASRVALHPRSVSFPLRAEPSRDGRGILRP